MSAFDQIESSKRPHAFLLHNRGPRYDSVELCGSMDDWNIRHPLQFDPYTNQWFITLDLDIGKEFFYKYIINRDIWVVNDEEQQKQD